MTTEIAGRIADNYAAVIDQVSECCRRGGRAPEDVTVIGVSKYVDDATTAMLVEAGCQNLGESRPQVLWQKAESGLIADDVHWHMIGHVQRNKVSRMLRRPVTVHSIDSPRILAAIGEAAVANERVDDVLLEINISGEANKTGLSPESADELIRHSTGDESVNGIRWIGLMAMASQNRAAEQFEQVRELRDRLVRRYEIALPELSMGMSGDFPAAINAGATMIRIGSAFFEGVPRT